MAKTRLTSGSNAEEDSSSLLLLAAFIAWGGLHAGGRVCWFNARQITTVLSKGNRVCTLQTAVVCTALRTDSELAKML